MKRALIACAALALSAVAAFAADEEHSIVLEIGGAGDWGFHGGAAYGPDIGLEFTVIKGVLEVATGVTPLISKGNAEIGTDLIFKKPFELSKQLEMLIGAGPEWIYRSGGESQRNSVAAVVVADFVYSQSPESAVAIFVEPAYSYDFGRGHEEAFSITAGLHIAVK
jgi:hypothetical protein